MKTLIIFYENLFPIDRGNKSLIVHFIEYLKNNKVNFTLVCIGSDKKPSDQLKLFIDDLIYIQNPLEIKVNKIINKLICFFALTKLDQHQWLQFLVRRKLRKEWTRYDHFILNYVSFYRTIPKKRKKDTLLFTHDIEFFRDLSFSGKKDNFSCNIRLMNREMELFKKFKKVILLAEYERKLLAEKGYFYKNLIVSGIPQKLTQNRFDLEEEIDFLFVGGNALQNIEALNLFIKEVYTHFSGFKFIILGKVCEQFSFDKEKYPNIKLKGFVEDIKEYYHKAKIIVGTIRSGSGVKVKILEGMSYSKVILSNSKGLEGIEATHLLDVINIDLFRDTNNLIEIISNSLNDKIFRKEMGSNASKLIKNNHSPRKCFEEIINNIK
ncbi:glycosyltransferase [Aquimarina muelleri]|uniref:glycosyltransferase n=1 Tax=Aquimarina muelleri TaxID=279356 RepID=UPI003F686F6D